MAEKIDKRLEIQIENTKIESNQEVAYIYIGKEDGNEFYQVVINDVAGSLVYFKDLTKRLRDVFGVSLDENIEEDEALISLGISIHRLMKSGIIKRYEIKNGSYVGKKDSKIVAVNKLGLDAEIILINSIYNGLTKPSGKFSY